MSHNSTPLHGDAPRPRASDLAAANAKQLLHAYIYDYLVKSQMLGAARHFVAEADIPCVDPVLPKLPKLPLGKDDLPHLTLAMDAPGGFLYEWWQVFWDVFQGRQDRSANPAAAQYYHMQLMKQTQHNEQHGLDWPQPDARHPVDPRLQRYMMQMAMKGQMPQPRNGPPMNVPVNQVPVNMNMNMMHMNQAPMMGPARIQQQAQTQMNNLRQAVQPAQQGPNAAAAAAVAAAAAAARQPRDAQLPSLNMRMGRRTQLALGQLQNPQSNGNGNGNGNGNPNGNGSGNNSNPPLSQPATQPGAGPPQGPPMYRNMLPGPVPMMNGMMPMMGVGQGMHLSALQDYQKQLVLLEQQNKKRLDIARLGADMQGMPPPKALPAPLPVLNGKTLPKLRKQKRLRKGSTAEEPKADYQTPLTPAADDKRKKSELLPKRKAKKRRKEDDDKDDDKKMPPPGYFPALNPKMEPVEILGPMRDSFFAGGNGSMDDIDLDFNLLLDTGDPALNDGMGFGWGNPIEGD